MNLHRRRVLSVLMALGAVTLAGCSYSGFRRTPMTDQSRSAIESVAIVRVHLPFGMQANTEVGGLAALINSLSDTGKNTRLKESFAGRSRHLAPWMTQALRRAVEDAGYRVRVIEVSRPQPLAMIEDVQAIGFDEDALLDVVITYCGFHGGRGMNFRPGVFARVRLLERSSGKTLYADEIGYGGTLGYPDSPTITRDPTFIFITANEFFDDPDRAIAMLFTGLDLVAKRVGERMNRQNRRLPGTAVVPPA